MVKRPDHVVVDAAGVGYRLAVSSETLREVPACGQRVTLYAHLVSRDDALNLYGFATDEERALFVSLTTVSGVGPKVALAALSDAPPGELMGAIVTSDAKRFQAVPGIGKRTAERIIVELRDKIAEEVGADPDGSAISAHGPDGARGEAREGLVGLGFTLQEAESLLGEAEGDSAEAMIQDALRRAGSAR